MQDDCSNCRFWQDLMQGEGQCRRYPPKRLYDMQLDEGEAMNPDFFGFPMTVDYEWCGEHKTK